MATIWFILVAVMIAAYVVLDGFDLGAGILHLFIAKTDDERRTVVRTIGPVWDGNEVWLLAGGGTLYFAFPLLYASSFSGFYLPLMIVLWLLILRALGIEFRAHLATPVWRGFFDGLFAISSIILAIFFGAALGNVIRGVPIGGDGYFFLPLWTDWRVGPRPGILDWYTVIAGVMGLMTLLIHGAHYVALKATGPVHDRARRAAAVAWPVLLALTGVSLAATVEVRPEVLARFTAHPIALIIPITVAASLLGMFAYRRAGRDLGAFLSSAVYIIAMLVGAAYALYPNVLPAIDPQYSLTIYNAASGDHALALGLYWWLPGMAIAVGYFVFVYRTFRGKVSLDAGGY
jgi:cytochrome bd ubiquinol oxidase subunit II